MVKVHFCDICNEIIHNRKFVFNILEVEKYDGDYNREHVMDVKQYEICGGCKNVMNYLINVRKKKLKKLRKECDKLLNQTKRKLKKQNGESK